MRRCLGVTADTCVEYWNVGHNVFHTQPAAVKVAIGEGKRTGIKHRVRSHNDHWKVEPCLTIETQSSGQPSGEPSRSAA